VVIQQIESNIITPRILGGKLGLHPLFIIFALLAGGNLYGIWGILFAVPVAAMIKVSITWLYLRYAS
jgi:predicted PurR-regulated permease PerM